MSFANAHAPSSLVAHVTAGNKTSSAPTNRGMTFRSRFVNNFKANRLPGANDDERDGYHVGSLWRLNRRTFICTSADRGEAVWDDLMGNVADALSLLYTEFANLARYVHTVFVQQELNLDPALAPIFELSGLQAPDL